MTGPFSYGANWRVQKISDPIRQYKGQKDWQELLPTNENFTTLSIDTVSDTAQT